MLTHGSLYVISYYFSRNFGQEALLNLLFGAASVVKALRRPNVAHFGFIGDRINLREAVRRRGDVHTFLGHRFLYRM